MLRMSMLLLYFPATMTCVFSGELRYVPSRVSNVNAAGALNASHTVRTWYGWTAAAYRGAGVF